MEKIFCRSTYSAKPFTFVYISSVSSSSCFAIDAQQQEVAYSFSQSKMPIIKP
jgi:hypothetical protein